MPESGEMAGVEESELRWGVELVVLGFKVTQRLRIKVI